MARKKGTGVKDHSVFTGPDGRPVPPPACEQPRGSTALPLETNAQSQTASQAELPTAPLPDAITYEIANIPWRVQRWKELVIEFENGLSPETMPQFHEALSAASQRQWTIVRRLFGVVPVMADPGTADDEMRTWSRRELCEGMAIEPKHLTEELKAIRGFWSRINRVDAPVEQLQEPSQWNAEKGELNLGDDEKLLAKYHLRVKFQDQAEKFYFIGRVKDFEKALDDKTGQQFARSALSTELAIMRLEAFLNDGLKGPKPGSGDYKSQHQFKAELEGQYKSVMAQLQKACPFISGVAGKFSFLGVMSEVTRGIMEYRAQGSTQLIDGMFTATEVLVECRMSVQAPQPRYRADVVVMVNAAKAGFWDPNWKCPIERADLALIQTGWSQAYKKASEAAGVKMPDLTRDDAEGEYPDLPVPVPETPPPPQNT